jgi:ribosomal protein S18 acetylase RimI-like enzyme
MAQEKDNSPNITSQPAQPSDASQVSRLIFDSFPKMATYILGLGNAERAKKILAKLFSQPGHRFSYESAKIIFNGNRMIGMFIAYPGSDLFKLNWRFAWLLIKQYKLAEKLKLIHRGLAVIFIQEAASDEYLLSNLAVKKGQRGKGIGAKILPSVEDQARQAGFHKLSLMVTIDNQDARRFYERHGFQIKTMHLESDRRARHLGPGYQRMVKELG